MNSAEYRFDRERSPNNAELINNDSFERLKSKNRRKQFRRRVFYMAVSLLLCAVFAFLCIYLFFGLKTVKIKGNDKYSSEEITESLGLDERSNLFFINFKKTENKITSQFPYIREATFQRILPSTLVITVTEDVPLFYTEIYGDWFLLSSDLRVISRYDMEKEIELLGLDLKYTALPEVNTSVTGHNISFTKESNYAYTVDFLNALREFEFFSNIGSIDAQDRYHIDIYTADHKYKISIGTSDNLEAKVRLALKIIKDELTENTVASINVEYLSSAIVLKQDSHFSFP